MDSPSAEGPTIHRGRLFTGICLALIPTGASFAIVSNILVPLKGEFILTNYQVGLIGGAALWGMAISLLVLGPMLEVFGLKNGTRFAFLAHLTGITLMISAVARAGDPSAFWILMIGAAVLAVGNGMIEVAGNPLVAALYPEEKTTRLNWFHAFFPIGMILGGIVGFLLASYGGGFGRWPFQLAVIYIPILAYGVMVLPEAFPKTENAEAGLPVGEMFRYTLTNPLFLLMLAMMAITTSVELGPMRWVPAMLEASGMHGILVLVWISGWMVVLRLLATHFVERLAPTGMLLTAAVLTGSGLFMLSFADGFWSALTAATIFAWGVAFFFPTMVGFVSERMPKTGSLGIVLTAGVGLGTAGAVGVPTMGKIADTYLAEALDPSATIALLESVESGFPSYMDRAQGADPSTLGYRARDIQEALDATVVALSAYRTAGEIAGDDTANALRAIVGTALPDEPLVTEAGALLMPAEAHGGQASFRYTAPLTLILILVFGAMYLHDRRAGGYRVVRLDVGGPGAGKALLLALIMTSGCAPPDGGMTRVADTDRLKVLFLGDDGHHRPAARARGAMPVLAANGIDLFYTESAEDLSPSVLERYDALILYNNQSTVSTSQLNALLDFVDSGHGLVVLHSASASFQNSETFIRLVGASFKSHGYGTFQAVRVAGDHPAIAGVPSFESWDETYIHAKHNPVDRTVLEVRREGDHDEPWTWVREYGAGRVFYTAWGHDERTWENEGFQELLGRGIRWASGDWALDLRPADPIVEMMALEIPLPTYERPPAAWNTLSDPVFEAQAALPTRESLKLVTLPPGFTVEPFAFEPMIGNVIDFTWDASGRLWVVETQDYPNNVLPDSVPGNDRILILEDTDRDGVADATTVFAEGLNLATSLTFAGGGLVVAQAPHIFFFEDTDGDDRADVKRALMTGWPRSDTHGTPSNFRYGLDNQVLASVGYNGYRGTVGGETFSRGDLGAGYFRFPADGSSLDYLARTSNNTWGVAQSEDGYVFGSTANRRPSNYVHIPGRYYRSIGMREPVLPGIEDSPAIYPVREILQVDQFDMYTAGSAHEIYTARAFPPEYWNSAAFVAEPTGHLIGMFDLQHRGSGFEAINRWSFLASRDEWAAPVQVKVGPDGALWVSDFYTLVAQHNPTPDYGPDCCERGPGNAYDTPNRDRLHGRIYRVVHEDAPRATFDLHGAEPDELVDALANDNMFWRLTAQRLLVERGEPDVVPALVELLSGHRVDELGLNPGALHALWTLDGLDQFSSEGPALDAARVALHHPASALRRSALMILPKDERLVDDIIAAGILPDRSSPTAVDYTVPTSVLQDGDAKVRLEALLTLSELPGSERIASILSDVLASTSNTRDRWLPDAAAIAGARQGPGFVAGLVRTDSPTDSASVIGMARAVAMMAEFHAASVSSESLVEMFEALPDASPPLGAAMIAGIIEGWPEGRAPVLSARQRSSLTTAARGTSGLTSQLQALEAHWGRPGIVGRP
jgi:putative membrane-bound dehydrogenase-like protein